MLQYASGRKVGKKSDQENFLDSLLDITKSSHGSSVVQIRQAFILLNIFCGKNDSCFNCFTGNIPNFSPVSSLNKSSMPNILLGQDASIDEHDCLQAVGKS